MALLGTFNKKVTKEFKITVTYNSTNPDISSDTVTLYLFDEDNSQALSKAADVATAGASGIASWVISSTEMNITEGKYRAVVEWVSGSKKLWLVEEDINVGPNYIT